MKNLRMLFLLVIAIFGFSLIAKAHPIYFPDNLRNLNNGYFTIFDLYADDSTVYLCTNDGLFESADEGKSWQKTYAKDEFYQIVKIDNSLLARDYQGIQRSDDNGKTWNNISASTIPPGSIHTIFATNHTLYVGGDSTLYMSNDLTHWLKPISSEAFPMITSLYTYNDAIYFGSSFDHFSLGLFRSVDQGKSWKNFPLSTEENSPIDDIYANSKYVYVLGANAQGENTLYITSISNLGSWQPVPNIHPNKIFGLGDIIYAGCNNGAYVSYDDGITWKPISDKANINFISATNQAIYLINDHEDLYISTDQGRTWHNSDYALVIPSIATDTKGTLYVATNNSLRISNNHAKTWASTLPDQIIHTVAINHQNQNIYAISNQTLFISSDMGATWGSIALPHYDDCFLSVYANGSNILIGTEHAVYATQDDFKTLTKVLDVNYAQDFFGDGNNIYLATANTIMKSNDGGQNWANLEPSQYISYFNTLYIANQSIYVGGQGIYYSKNQTNPWLLMNGTNNWEVTSISGNNTKLFVVHDNKISITDNEGTTWNTLSTPFAVSSFLRTTDNKFYAGSQDTGLYMSDDQGKSWKRLF